MAEKIRGFCSLLEKMGLGYEFIARFLNISFVLIALTMLFKTKYYSANYVTIELWFSDFILKTIFFIIIFLSFSLIFLPMSKIAMKERSEKKAGQYPVFYQISKVLAPILLFILIIFLALPLLIKGFYLDLVFMINWCIIVIFQDYYYYPTAHKP
ncbi:MAG: hypothetical protein HYW34_03225 [Candidatus Brennerbacteria bacterium]|nr:hypothetical protein [Candidatus Brennerbacteria bacterium]